MVAANDTEQLAAIVENNLWYYPLDGNPAIIDAEASGGGDHFYIDVTFSEGVANADGGPVSEAEFEGAVTFVNRTAAYTDTRPVVLTVKERGGVTRPGGEPVQAGDSVIRLHFNEDPADVIEAAASLTDPNVLVSIEPPDDKIYSSDNATELKRGEEWWVRVWHDFRAPYVQTAVFGGGSRNVDITFDKPVKFDISYSSDTPPVVTAGTRAPEPEDFIIRYYDASEDTVTDYAPTHVTDFTATEPDEGAITPAAGTEITELRLWMPDAITADFEPTVDTIDVRTAQRQKDIEHPSLASVFLDAVRDADKPTSTKDSKFATEVSDTNFPRTAAFAQVGSLPLKGRTFHLVVHIDDASTGLLAGGPAKTFSASLESVENSALDGDTAQVRLSGTGLVFPGGNLRFNALGVQQDFDVRALQTARGTPAIMANLANNIPKTSVFSSPLETVMIDRNFTVTFEDSDTTPEAPGRLVAPPVMDESIMEWTNRVRFGLFGDATALLVPGEELVVEFGWEGSDLAGATIPMQQVTLTADAPATDVVVILNRTATANIDEDNMSDATLTMTCISAPPGVTCDGRDDSSPPVPDIDVSNKLYVDIVEEQLVAVRFSYYGVEVDENDRTTWPPALIGGKRTPVGVYLDAEVLEGTDLGGVDITLTAPEGSGITFSETDSNGADSISIRLGPEHVADNPMIIYIGGAGGASINGMIEVEASGGGRAQAEAFRIQTPPRRFANEDTDGNSTPGSDHPDGVLFAKVVPNNGDIDAGRVDKTGDAVVRTIGNDDYLLIPGPGPLTPLNLAEAVSGSDEGIYACVRQVETVNEEVEPVEDRDGCTRAATNADGEDVNEFRLLSGDESSVVRSVWNIGPYLNEILWAGLDESGTLVLFTTQPRWVYVAPMVGFSTTYQRYEGTDLVDVSINVVINAERTDSDNLPVIEYEISGVDSAGDEGDSGVATPTSPELAIDSGQEAFIDTFKVAGVNPGPVEGRMDPAISTYPDGRTLTITKVGEVTGKNHPDGENFPGEISSTDTSVLVNKKLFSVGNDRITLLQYEPPEDGLTIVTNDGGGATLQITPGSDDILPLYFAKETGGDISMSVFANPLTITSDDNLAVFARIFDRADVNGTITLTSSPTEVVRKDASSGRERTFAWESELGVVPGELEVGDFVIVYVEATSTQEDTTDEPKTFKFQFPVVPATFSAFTAEKAEAGVYALAQANQDSDNPLLLNTGFLTPVPDPDNPDGEEILTPLFLDPEGDEISTRSGVHDYVVTGLRAGQVFTTVLAPLPGDDGNRLCVRAQIADGSINDADMSDNGVIHDPVAATRNGQVMKYAEDIANTGEFTWSRVTQGGDFALYDLFHTAELAACPAPSASLDCWRTQRREDDHGSGAMEPLWLALLAAGLLLSGIGLRRRKVRLPLATRK